MRRRYWIGVFAVLVLAMGGTVGFLSLREPPTPEEQIRQLLRRGEEGVERKRLWEVMSCVSHAYNDGVNTYRDVQRGFIYLFHENDALDVTWWEPTIRVAGDRAEVVVPLVVRGLRGGQVLEYSLNLHLKLRKEGRHWKVVWAGGWEPATPLAEGEEGIFW